MIRSVTTLAFGVAVAVLILITALVAAVWVIGMAAKAALFGEPKASLAMKVLERLRKERKVTSTDITDITPHTEHSTAASLTGT